MTDDGLALDDDDVRDITFQPFVYVSGTPAGPFTFSADWGGSLCESDIPSVEFEGEWCELPASDTLDAEGDDAWSDALDQRLKDIRLTIGLAKVYPQSHSLLAKLADLVAPFFVKEEA